MDTTIFHATLLALTLSPTLAAQTAGLPPGEMLLYNPIATNWGPDGAAIQRLDPLTGQVTVLQPLGEALYRPGAMCIDAWRDRIVFYGKPTPGTGFMRLYELTASGQLTDLGYESDLLYLLTPGPGGLIYLHDESASGILAPLRYLDGSNVRYDLLDATGTQPYTHIGLVHTTAMGYDPDLNALLLAIPSEDTVPTVLCPGGNYLNLTILRLDLSADGKRVSSTSCTQVVIDPLGANAPVQLSRMNDGDWLLAVDTNSNDSQARLQRIDPATLAVTPFAFNGFYTGAAITDFGCWSSLRGEALLSDTFNQKLWSVADGGAKTLVPTSQPLVWAGLYGFWMCLREVPPPACADSVGFYCTAKTSAAGCLPKITTAGGPSATAAAGFTVAATQVPPGKFGLLFYGISGGASTVFQGGFLCVKPPLTRTSVQVSSGAGACGGAFAMDFNSYVATGFDPLLVPGAIVSAQYWFRDPAEPVYGSGLTGGVRFTLCP